MSAVGLGGSFPNRRVSVAWELHLQTLSQTDLAARSSFRGGLDRGARQPGRGTISSEEHGDALSRTCYGRRKRQGIRVGEKIMLQP
jgi:hypothetical protein